MDAQLPIKILLIAALAAFALILILPTRGSRQSAIRRLALLVLFAIAVFAVIIPDALSTVAAMLGIGRGTDLLLYGFIVVLLGQMLTTSRHYRAQERHITELARRQALESARVPPTEPPAGHTSAS
ncbi:MAG TPA: DUF2304 domain-containing protein [Propionicimonas sp.]|nr:DUF2304 domain-containing protein [Propionicimonas sp.]